MGDDEHGQLEKGRHADSNARGRLGAGVAAGKESLTWWAQEHRQQTGITVTDVTGAGGSLPATPAGRETLTPER